MQNPLLLFIISTVLASCCCKVYNPPTTEAMSGLENRQIWRPTMVDTIKNDTVIVYGKTDYDVVKIKFALTNITKTSYGDQKNYQVSYNLVAPASPSVFKLDTTVKSNYLSARYFNDTKTNWLSCSFNLTFINTTPATTIYVPPVNLAGGFNIKMP